MWLKYFLAFVCIIALVRILIFAFSSGSFEDKLGKAKNWIIGLALLSLSWFILAKLFGIGSNMSLTEQQNDTEINSEAFGGSNQGQNQNTNNSVPIKLD